MATTDFKGGNLYDQFSITDNFADIPKFIINTQEVKPHEALLAGMYTGYKGSFINAMLEKVQKESSSIVSKIQNQHFYTPEEAKEIFGMEFKKPVSARYLHGFLDTLDGVKNAEQLKSKYADQEGGSILPFLGDLGAGLLADSLPFIFVGFPASRIVRGAVGSLLRKTGLALNTADEFKYATALTEGVLSSAMQQVVEERDVQIGLKDSVTQANVLGAGFLGGYFGGLAGKAYGKHFSKRRDIFVSAMKQRLKEDPQMSFQFDEALKQQNKFNTALKADMDALIDIALDKGAKSFLKGQKVTDDILKRALEDGAEEALRVLDGKLPNPLRSEDGFVRWSSGRKYKSVYEHLKKIKDRKEFRKALLKSFTAKIEADHYVVPEIGDFLEKLKIDEFRKKPKTGKVELIKSTLDEIDPENVIRLIHFKELSTRQRYHIIKDRMIRGYIIDERYEILKARMRNLSNIWDSRAKEKMYKRFQRQKLSDSDFFQFPLQEGASFGRSHKKQTVDDFSSFDHALPFMVGASLTVGSSISSIGENIGEFFKRVFKSIGERVAPMEETEKDNEEEQVKGATMHLVPLLFSNLSIEAIMNFFVRGFKIGESEDDFVPWNVDEESFLEPNSIDLLNKLTSLTSGKDEQLKGIIDLQGQYMDLVKNVDRDEIGAMLDNQDGFGFAPAIEGMDNIDEETKKFFNRPDVQKLKATYEKLLGKKFVLRTTSGVNEFLFDMHQIGSLSRSDIQSILFNGGDSLQSIFEYNQDMIFGYPFEEFESRLDEAKKNGVDVMGLTQKQREEMFGIAVDELADKVISSEIDDRHKGIESYLEVSLKNSAPSFQKLVTDIEGQVEKGNPSSMEDAMKILKDWVLKPDVGIIDVFNQFKEVDKEVVKFQEKNLNASNIFRYLGSEPRGKSVYGEDLFNLHGVLVSNVLSERLAGLSFGRVLYGDYDTGFLTSSKRLLNVAQLSKRFEEEGVDVLNLSSGFGVSSEHMAEKVFKSALKAGVVVFQSVGNTQKRSRQIGLTPDKYDNYVAAHAIAYKDSKEFEEVKDNPELMFRRFEMGGEYFVLTERLHRKSQAPGIKEDLSIVQGTSFTAPLFVSSYLKYLRGAVLGEERLGPYLKRLFHNYGVRGGLPKEYKKEVRMASLRDWVFFIKQKGKIYESSFGNRELDKVYGLDLEQMR